MDPIQVLGQKDLRRKTQVNCENTAGQLLVKNKPAEDRYVRGISKSSKRVFINRKDSPVKNHFEGLPNWSREEAIRAFDSDLWSKHQRNSMEKQVRDWFHARVNELMAGHNIDLIDDIDHVECVNDSHGYSLKTYIEYLAKNL
tara:strand:+ start:1606 stop:2034 length:429 start_codon:yes stop_codon:yes gene_type:complete